ncbi:hypothetical protein ACFQZC_26395 [Streptacidiphilus monticola]
MVHLHDTAKHVSTALLITDPAAGRTSALLLPDGTGIPADEGSDSLVALGSSVDDLGNSTVRSGINSLLGSDATATWGLYTPSCRTWSTRSAASPSTPTPRSPSRARPWSSQATRP